MTGPLRAFANHCWTLSWVFGPEVVNPGNHTIYEPSKSSTPTNDTFSIRYMAGFGASGSVVKDTVGFGSVSVKDVAVGVATEVGDGNWPDGMIGMGFKSSCTPPSFPLPFVESHASKADGHVLQSNPIIYQPS